MNKRVKLKKLSLQWPKLKRNKKIIYSRRIFSYLNTELPDFGQKLKKTKKGGVWCGGEVSLQTAIQFKIQ